MKINDYVLFMWDDFSLHIGKVISIPIKGHGIDVEDVFIENSSATVYKPTQIISVINKEDVDKFKAQLDSKNIKVYFDPFVGEDNEDSKQS